MSKLSFPDGDDHPEAAQKHLEDASRLLNGSRPDGAAYLAGYVVECSLKTLILLEKQSVGGAGSPLPWKGQNGHNITMLLNLAASLASVAGAKTARYLGNSVKSLPSAGIAAWDPAMRYRAPCMTLCDAQKWFSEAQNVYYQTIGNMIKDGVL